MSPTQKNNGAKVQAQLLFQKGLEFLQAGNMDEADLLFSKSYNLHPENIDTINLLGIRQYQQQNYPEAIRHLSVANLLRGNSAQTLSNLSLVYLALEEFQKALEFSDTAMAIDANTPEIQNNRGNALKGLFRNDEALKAYEAAIQLRPNYAEAIANIGVIFLERKDFLEAITYFEKAIELNPHLAVAFNSLGNAYTELGQYESAFQAFEHALQISPHYLDACLNFGVSLKKAKEYDASIGCFQHAIELSPTHAKTYYLLGEVLYDIGDIASAKINLEKSVRLNPQDIEAQFSLTISQIPKVAIDIEELKRARKGLNEHLTILSRLHTDNQNLEKLLRSISRHPFYLAYQENDNRMPLTQFGNICIKVAQPIQELIEHENTHQKQINRKIQVGIVSHYFSNHPVWHAITKGWLMQLDQTLFDIHIFNTNGIEDQETDLAKAKAKSYINSRHSAIEIALLIREKNLDVLLFPEVGMDTTTKALSCLRMAPVQVVSWGHPESTGLASIDYFLSADDFEQSTSQNNYSEELIQLPKLGTYFELENIQSKVINLDNLGIDRELPVLLCAGSPSKYSPENDCIFIDIAKRLGKCQFIFFNFQPELTSIFKNRVFKEFREAGLNPEHFIRFIPFLKKEEFYSLLHQSDLYLDTLGFSGFNTAMQAIACDLPIVTKEGKFMRGKLASAILCNLQLDSLVAKTNEEYINIAVNLIQNNQLLKSYKTKIAQSKLSVFENLEPIRALEQFLIQKSKSGK